MLTKKQINDIKSFHGHIGPYVMLGYKLGKFIVKKHKRIKKIQYYGPIKPPAACLVDGLQLATHCTYGRDKITKYSQTNNIHIVFIYQNGSKDNIKINKSCTEAIKKSMASSLYHIKKENILHFINNV